MVQRSISECRNDVIHLTIAITADHKKYNNLLIHTVVGVASIFPVGCTQFLPQILTTFFGHHLLRYLTRIKLSISTACLPPKFLKFSPLPKLTSPSGVHSALPRKLDREMFLCRPAPHAPPWLHLCTVHTL